MGDYLTRKEREVFIDKIAPAAQSAARTHGVPASVTIAQAILESGWGRHAPGNNFFGIKKGAANVPYLASETTEFVNGKPQREIAKFRAFATVAMGFSAHAHLLSTDDRYARAMSDADNPIVFATRLRQCGYATDPRYDDKLVAIMRDYKLARFDSPRPHPKPRRKGRLGRERADCGFEGSRHGSGARSSL